MMIQTGSSVSLRRGDWVRFQLKSDRRVLEGFIQAISPDGSKLRIGKAPDWPEYQWFDRSEVILLQHQSR